MMVTVIGLASLFAVRVQRRSAIVTKDCAEARLCAQSAVELGLYYVSSDSNWRTTWPNGTWVADQPLGNGSFTLEGIDPDDGVLNDSDTDPLVLTGTGQKGLARQKMQVRLVAKVPFATMERRVAANNDDAEERSSNGNMLQYSHDLELAFDDNVLFLTDTVGMRFTGVTIPQGATVASAYVQFKVDETDFGSASLTIRGEGVDDAPAFADSDYDITSRTTTTAAVAWSPPAWWIVGQVGPDQRTPNIVSVIQEIVDRPGWTSGNALVIIITGSGTRTAESYDGYASGAPLLRIEPTVSIRPVSGTWRREVLP